MRHCETLSGCGFVTNSEGVRRQVTYRLEVWQEMISVSRDMPPIPGLKKIVGHVIPVSDFTDRGLNLQLEDGRTMKFFFTELQGTIAFSGWIEE